MPRNTSVTLGDYFDEFVAEILQQGRFQSVSEIIRAGLRMLEADEKKLLALRAKLQAGEDSPVVEDFDGEQFIARMHKKHTP
ncbi:MAG: type II toxin-antitoxin system ParD family antitoxin [Gammaproteobacteria bacterium]|nr:MAG: type II toxin-antitoxin system ParD family antitoxin [Gammaproteobacteria bacterium]